MKGESLSHYRLVEEVGRGGMGTVYKAEDSQLKRTVAIKVLPAEQFRDEEFKARFLHEAQAAAALDHPNICGIYEIDEVGGRLFMALPFLDGEGLDRRIELGPRPINEVLRISVQIAEALEEAHSKGIVHRDIKSGNVMVQQKGRRLHCMLLDFGLAKLAHGTKLTRTGSRMGTAGYMAPEQVEGAEVDRRSDIWSLGVVIYEMTAGELPFPSDYEQAQFYAILNEEPEPLSAIRTGVPRELERIVGKCLSKEPSERYQSCTDLIVDLAALQTPGPSRASRGTRSRRGTVVKPAPPARTKASPYRALVALVIAALSGGAAAWLAKPSESVADWVPRYEISRLTWDSGLSMNPSITSDGRLVAYSSDRDGGGRLDIWVEQTGGGGRVQVTDKDDEDLSPVFSPDASTLAFVRVSAGKPTSLFLTPSLGGTPRFLAADAFYPAFSPDGERISFASPDGQLMLVSTVGGEPRALQSGFSDVHSSLWLPDGKHILFSAIEPPNNYDWWITSVDGEERRPTGFVKFQRSARGLGELNLPPQWIEPGRWILYGAGHSLWRIPFSSGAQHYTGPPEALSFGPSTFESVSVADDGSIAAGTVEAEDGVWSVPLNSAPDAPMDPSWRMLSGAISPSLSRSARRIAYVGRTGTTDVYVRDLAAGSTMNLTNNVNHVQRPAISGDGKHVAYQSRPSQWHGERSIKAFSFDSGQSRLLCEDCGQPESWSGGNEHLLVTDGDPSAVYRVRLSDGERSEFIRFGDDLNVKAPRHSPDGSWIAFYLTNDSETKSQVLVAPAGEGRPIARDDCIEVTDGTYFDWMPRWGPDSAALYLLSNRVGHMSIWSIELGPDKRALGEPTPVRIFDTTRFSLAALAVSEPGSVGYEVDTDHIYLTVRELTGRIHMLRPTSREDGGG